MRRPLRPVLAALLILSGGCDVYHLSAFDNFDAGLDARPPGDLDAGSDAGPPAIDDAGRDAEPVDAGPIDAGPPADAGTDGGLDAGPFCDSSEAPPPPAVADSADGPRVVLALRDIVIDQPDGIWQSVAVNLDNACTDSTVAGTCSSRSGGGDRADGPRGEDNATGPEILALARMDDPEFQENARESQAEGRGAMLLVIDGWNGAPDDPRVNAFISTSVYGAPNGGVRDDPLLWDGTDSIFVSELDFSGGDVTMPIIADTTGYVSGGTFVMDVPDGRTIYFPRRGALFEVRLTDGQLIGQLVGGQLVDAKLVGRWAIIDISTTLTQLGLCPGSIERFSADAIVNRAADVRSNEADDGMGVECDALSFGMGFTGYPAQLGGLVALEPGPDACP